VDIIVVRVWRMVDGSDREEETIDLVYPNDPLSADLATSKVHALLLTLLDAQFRQSLYSQNSFE
jgi:hypothetical protein